MGTWQDQIAAEGKRIGAGLSCAVLTLGWCLAGPGRWMRTGALCMGEWAGGLVWVGLGRSMMNWRVRRRKRCVALRYLTSPTRPLHHMHAPKAHREGQDIVQDLTEEKK